jgi:hypothetical protein
MKEAMKLALEALESCTYTSSYYKDFSIDKVDEAIKALEEALASEQEQRSDSEQLGEPYECVCGANLYIDANGIPRSKASIEPATVMFKQEQGEQDMVSKARYNRVRDDYNALLEKSQQDAKHAEEWRQHVKHCQLQGVDLDHNFSPQQRKPLTDEQIKKDFESWAKENYVQGFEPYGDSYHNGHTRNRWQGWLAAHRSIEAAHGIKENT